MQYKIVLAPQAEEDLLNLKAHERAKAIEAIEKHLRYEPEKTSKSRIKRLQKVDWPKYRLRIDNLRVFYDLVYEAESGVVEVLVVREKMEAMKWLAEFGRKTHG